MKTPSSHFQKPVFFEENGFLRFNLLWKISPALDRQRHAIISIVPSERVIKRIGRVVVHHLRFRVRAHRAVGFVIFQTGNPGTNTNLVKARLEFSDRGFALRCAGIGWWKTHRDLVLALWHGRQRIRVT